MSAAKWAWFVTALAYVHAEKGHSLVAEHTLGTKFNLTHLQLRFSGGR